MQKTLNFYYKPKSFCKEYVEIKGDSNQLIQFMATVLGIKKAYDDWFPLNQVERIEEMCKEYGIKCKFDWIFVSCEDVSNVISGGERLPTTKMFGFPFKDRYKHIENGSIHVFFSKSKENLEMAFKNGWYPLIVNNRAIHKPYIDLLRFGYFLGYPDCCINFFRKYNNHFLYNHLLESLKNTKTKPRKYCNPLLKNNTFSYIYHMPCSYDCKSTIKYVSNLRKELLEVEPQLVEITDNMLEKPFFVFKEQDAYIFEGKIKNSSIYYSKFEFLNDNLPIMKDKMHKALERGDRLEATKGIISVYHKDKKIYAEEKEPNHGFMIEFI